MIHTALVPANRSEQTRFGVLDGAVVAFVVLLLTTGLVFLLVQ
jgi:hypothetical protein